MVGKNTEFRYMYRCAANYKEVGQVIFSGSLPADKLAMMRQSFMDGHYFIARQISVPSAFPWDIGTGNYDDEFDHCWHEFCTVDGTDEPATDKRTAEQFANAVVTAAAHGWAEYDADPEAF